MRGGGEATHVGTDLGDHDLGGQRADAGDRGPQLYECVKRAETLYDLVARANNDTLYSTTFADLRAEPIVVSVPPTGDRYFVVQLVDMGTDNFAYIGTRSTGGDGGDFVLVGPTFKGAVPSERFCQVIACPSQFVALATRTALDAAADLDAVIEIQDQLDIRPLSDFLGTGGPESVAEIAWPPYTPELHGSPLLLQYMDFLLQWHTPPLFESELLGRFAAIGVGPHLTFDFEAFEPEVQAAIRGGIAEGHSKIEARGNALGTVVDGWEMIPPMGDYGDDYLFRSAVAWKFIYTNSPAEALYPIANVDGDGEQLNGRHEYVLHFSADQLPPVDAFWSITMYDATSRLMVHNPKNRYSIGDRTPGLARGADGSLVIHIQAESPGAAAHSNWLPAPEGDFYLITRAYMPRESFQTGSYRLPPVARKEAR